LLTRNLPLIGAAALAAALAACSHAPVKPILDPVKAQQAYAVGEKLAAQDRAQQVAHRKEIAKLIDAHVINTRERNRTISLLIRLHNKSAKTIRTLDSGVFVYDTAGKRTGMTEITLAKPIAPHATTAFWYPMRYLRFGEDAGTMALAARKAKRVTLDVTEIKYTDGSDAGYDD
jgi:hypothetical protein